MLGHRFVNRPVADDAHRENDAESFVQILLVLSFISLNFLRDNCFLMIAASLALVRLQAAHWRRRILVPPEAPPSDQRMKLIRTPRMVALAKRLLQWQTADVTA